MLFVLATLRARVVEEGFDFAVLCDICGDFFLLVAKESVDALIESPLDHGHVLAFAGGVQDGGSGLGVLVADVENKGGTGVVKETDQGREVSRLCVLVHQCGGAGQVLRAMG